MPPVVTQLPSGGSPAVGAPTVDAGAPGGPAPPDAGRSAPRSSTVVRTARHERTMSRIRWAAVVFGVVQIQTYYAAYPPGVRPLAYGLVALLAAGNIGLWWLTGRVATDAQARWLALASLLLDGAVVMGFVWVYTFDRDTAIWALMYILPLEGAVRFQLRGALLTMTAMLVLYVLREMFGEAAYGTELLVTSISFRMGIGYIIAMVAGTMAASLVRERDELQRAKVALESYAADLAAANGELQAANLVKDDFLSMTNHELRTPLTTILGYASMLEKRWDVLPEERKRQSVRWIDSQGRRLLALVEDLLTVSSAQAGALHLVLGPVDVAVAADEAIEQNGQAAVGVINACPPGLVVRADPDRLVQILINYVSNALKYGRPPVVIAATAVAGNAEIRVCDEGDGVAAEFVPRLFDRFTQASQGLLRTSEGTGLGLAIVEQLARAQGGKAWYERNEPSGSRFCVRLPLAGATPEAAEGA